MINYSNPEFMRMSANNAVFVESASEAHIPLSGHPRQYQTCVNTFLILAFSVPT